MIQEYINKLFSLDGKKAIVTGASQGIGKATAISLANFGAEVGIVGRNQKYIGEVVSEIVSAGGKAEGYHVDVSDKAQVDHFFDGYLEKHSGVDIFVNNAAYTVRKQILETQSNEIDGLINTNLKGAIYCLQRAGRIMREQRSGNIVIVTSITMFSGLPSQGVYSSTKGALEIVMKCLAVDLAPYGVRVNSCVPGAIDTAMNREFYSHKDLYDAAVQRIPLRKVGLPVDIGDVVAYMVSDASRYMTGSSVVVDGGLHLSCIDN
ncbi:MAG: SDR family oxidoreductase [Actinobacteria bacterium]|nr:SDR family oxidoreductase [Actinomycetota bacterium]